MDDSRKRGARHAPRNFPGVLDRRETRRAESTLVYTRPSSAAAINRRLGSARLSRRRGGKCLAGQESGTR
jgi:hypothetical protein